ncbi:MAG: preprotein translocase subunit SecG [Clostridiales Family XIII bacterium]|nr:preprotein translocase subunit SecG [Clostridiales Family XIII bacterium]
MVLTLKILLVIASLILIASVLLQQGNSAGLSGSIGGGAEQLFGKKKSRGLEKYLTYATIGGAIIFIVSSLVLVAME